MAELSAPVGRIMRTTWRVHVRDIAAALGIPVTPDQWVMLEDADGKGDQVLSRYVDVVRWENVPIHLEPT